MKVFEERLLQASFQQNIGEQRFLEDLLHISLDFIRRSARKVLQHAKTHRIMPYTQKWGRLPKLGLGLCGRTLRADLRSPVKFEIENEWPRRLFFLGVASCV